MGTTYYYRVVATNAASFSPDSAPVSVRPLAVPVVTPKAYSRGVKLDWPAVPGATGYRTRISTTAGGATFYNGVASDLTTVQGNSTLGATYYYRVSAFNAQGSSFNVVTLPAKPLFITAMPNLNAGTVLLEWQIESGNVPMRYYGEACDKCGWPLHNVDARHQRHQLHRFRLGQHHLLLSGLRG